MVFSLCIILLAFIVIVIKAHKNIYTTAFMVGVLSVSVLLFAMILYVDRMTVYSAVFPLEKTINEYISKIPISYFSIGLIVNFSRMLFFVFTQILYWQGEKYRKSRINITVFQIVGLIVVCLLLFGFNSQFYYEKIYILSHTSAENKNIYRMTALVYISNIVWVIMCVMPCIKLIIQLIKTRILVKKQNLKTVLIATLTIEIIYFLLLLLGPTKRFVASFELYDFYKRISIQEQAIYIYFAVIIMIAVIAFAALLIKRNIFDISSSYGEADHRQNIFVEDIRHVFHRYKNTMFTISILAENALKHYGEEESIEAINKIKGVVSEYSQKTNEFLDVYNNSQWTYKAFEIRTAIEKAISKVAVFEDISINAIFEDDGTIIYGMEDVIAGVFENLFINAIEAIRKKKCAEGKIIVRVFCEAPWVCISVTDNGIGMDKKMCKRIFRPFYTTQNISTNWGIGLTYVENAIDAHDGRVSVISTPGVSTEFQVILPDGRV